MGSPFALPDVSDLAGAPLRGRASGAGRDHASDPFAVVGTCHIAVDFFPGHFALGMCDLDIAGTRSAWAGMDVAIEIARCLVVAFLGRFGLELFGSAFLLFCMSLLFPGFNFVILLILWTYATSRFTLFSGVSPLAVVLCSCLTCDGAIAPAFPILARRPAADMMGCDVPARSILVYLPCVANKFAAPSGTVVRVIPFA